MAKTVVGLMDSMHEAQNVLQELANNGFQRDTVTVSSSNRGGEEYKAGSLSKLGVPEEEAGFYEEGVRRGGFLVTLTADDATAEKAAEIMRRHGAIDIDQRSESWRKEGWNRLEKGAAPQAATREREGVIPVVEEEVQVGKRQVQTGGVRVYSRVTQVPVEEQVHLREERAKVERRPVDRPASEMERDAFKERSFEVRETAEEPIVTKQARVKEEVTIGKEAAEKTQAVRETVRRTDVEVEKTGGYGQQDDDTDYQRHFSSTYGSKGGVFDSYRSAYHYAESRSAEPRFQGKDWNQVEEDFHQDWERGHPGTWAKVKEAIHYGWNKTHKH